jgi:hypothetical protein
VPWPPSWPKKLVTTQQLDALHDATAAYKPMLGAPRQQIAAGTLLRDDAVRHLGDAHAKLDVRYPTWNALPELVAAYHKARETVNTGRDGKRKAPKAA